ncbi:isocitrate lyase [Klebsiella pneumoniae subsp. ozaenae]|uniref:Isocitrate lyase n=1 Tax=Klebsiella pneumoniae subsp. ozaenae TaxID=574 RepID=A0A378AW30_KLEPO|nr:isocitrate lyase [Klebsiella pneumoniae subsp. ozaenae]
MEHLHMKTRTQQIEELNKEWTNPRWEGITRPYSAEEVVKLRGSVNPECTLAQLGAAKLWRLLHGGGEKRVRQQSRRADRRPGLAAGEGGYRSHLSLRLAGGGGC